MRTLYHNGGFPWNNRDRRQNFDCLPLLIRYHFVVRHCERLHLIALLVIRPWILRNRFDLAPQGALGLLLLLILLSFLLRCVVLCGPLSLGLIEVDQFLWNLLPITALGAVIPNAIVQHLILPNHVIIAILQ